MRRLAPAFAAALAAILAGILVSATPAAAMARAATPQANRVLIVSYPGLTWAGVASADAPALLGLLGQAAAASMSVQTATDHTTAPDGYLTVGAGNRADARLGPGAPSVAAMPTADGFLVPAAEALRAHNDDLLYGAKPGALGTALAARGQRAAVVGQGVAALAVMDATGRGAGRVGPAMDGVDASAIVPAFTEQWQPGAAVLVELRDPTASDAALAGLLAEVDLAHDLVLVISPVAPHDRAELTVFAMAGAGTPAGRARSASTRRAGYVTLPDVAPTVLATLGVDRPSAMTGTPISAVAGSPVDAATLADRDARSVFRERAVVPVTVAFLVLQLAVYGATALLFRRGRARLVLAAGLLAVLAYPALTFLSGATAYERLGLGGYVATLVGGAVAVGAVACLLGRHQPLVPPLVLAGATWLLLVVDGLRGGRLQLDTPFGYSPITAARFAGMGNLGFALLMVTAIVVATGAWPLWPGVGPAPSPRPERAPNLLLGLAGAGFVISVAVDGVPTFGADVGGVLALLPALAVTWLLLAGVQVGVTRLAMLVAAGVAAVVALAAYDLSRPDDRQTHLGRFARRVLDGDAGITIERKLSSNLHVLANVGVIVAVVLAAGALVAAGRSGPFAAARRRVPGVRAAVFGSAVGAVLGFGVNDSGIVVPGMMLAVLVPWFVLVAFELEL